MPFPRDVLRLPGIGAFLQWRHSRLALQLVSGALLLLLILEGLFGPELAPKNLSTLLVWVHYRGLLVVALLAVGNVFCMGCPLLLPRSLARRLFKPVRSFPRILRRKWIAVGTFIAILFSYEAWDLWADPRWTAGLILILLGSALAVDASFKGAPFCKFVCPIGQFNFLASTFSPTEVRARDLDICGSCRTKDCIRGRRDEESQQVTQQGCELALYLPLKEGNLDCTFCLDCVHACPHDNVAIALRLPGEELVSDPVRSGIGRLSKRRDLAVLAVMFCFGALLNAFGMVEPVYELQVTLAGYLGTNSEPLVLAVLFALGLVLLPALMLGLAGRAALKLARSGNRIGAHLIRMAWSLVPLGVGIWTAHYMFHFLTGLWTFVPVAQHLAERTGLSLLGAPDWGRGGLHESLVLPIELGFLGFGVIGSLAIAVRLLQQDFGARWRAAFTPWAVVHVSLFSAAVWLMLQPMDMRGTFL